MEKTTSSLGSSIRRYSLSISSSHGSHHHNIDNDAAESESVVSEVGDIGDRALRSRRFSESNSIRLSFDNRSENGVDVDVDVVYNQEEQRLQPHSSFSHPNSSVRPFPSELTSTSPLSTHTIVGSEHPNQEPRKGLPVFLDYASCMVQLAVFGILGVFTRYLLQKLFGPGNAAVTSNHTLLYLDLPSNMVGSFLMGWFGVVFKGDIISNVSENLAIAITTGYLGSLTTFSGWNQKMLELAVSGHWLYSALGFLIGMFLVAYSIIFGIKTAKGFRWLLKKMNRSSGNGNFKIKSKLESCSSQFNVMVFFLVILVILWSVSGALVKSEFKHGGSAAQLWFACLVSPIGVWIRWFLARLNGRGLGKAGLFKWIPFGTLIANVSAACVMAALSSLKEAVNSRDCDTVVGGIQFGVMGCLSTVSTFASEFNAMSESNQPWKADAYAIITICVSFSLGILIYGVPVWTKGFNIEA